MADTFNNSIKRDISMVRGDTLSFGFQITGLEGERPDAIYFSCKENLEDDSYIFSISTADGISERSYDAETDTLTYGVRVAPQLTENIEFGKYFYDLQLDINDDVLTLMKGKLNIEWEVKES
jgi:hypothetical protein